MLKTFSGLVTTTLRFAEIVTTAQYSVGQCWNLIIFNININLHYFHLQYTVFRFHFHIFHFKKLKFWMANWQTHLLNENFLNPRVSTIGKFRQGIIKYQVLTVKFPNSGLRSLNNLLPSENEGCFKDRFKNRWEIRCRFLCIIFIKNARHRYTRNENGIIILIYLSSGAFTCTGSIILFMFMKLPIFFLEDLNAIFQFLLPRNE